MLRVENPAIMTGFAGTPEAVADAGVAGAWGNVPCISHWASGDQLTNRAETPTIVRTVTADGDIANTTVEFLIQMKYSVIGVAHLDIDSGPALAKSVSDLMYGYYSQQPDVRFQVNIEQFVEQDVDSMTAAIKKLVDMDLKVYVLIQYADDLALIAEALRRNNALTDDKLFVVIFLDRQLEQEEITADPVLANFCNGVINIHNAIPINASLFENYVSLWPTFDAEDFASELPPYGTKNSTWVCRNQNIKYLSPTNPIYNGTFFKSTQRYAYEVWGQAYDAMLAVGFAICATDPTGTTVPRGINLYNDLVAVSFTGLTGLIEFNPDTGNRKLTSEPIRMRNWMVSSNGTFTNDFVANYDAKSNSWIFQNESSILFRGNVRGLSSAPRDFIMPVHNHNYLPAELRSLAYFETAFLLALAVASFAFLHLFRHKRTVLNSQPLLMHIVVLGCALASFSILMLSIDDNPENPLQNVAAGCAAAPVLYEIGSQLAFFAIIAKTWRIYVLFQSSQKLHRRSYTANRAVGLVVGALLMEMALILAWLITSPMHWERIIQFTDAQGDVVSSYGWCAATKLSGSIGIAILCLHGLAIIGGAIAARGVRDVPTEFGESKFIAFCVGATAQIYFLTVPTAVAVYSDVIGRFIILSSFAFFTILAVYVFMILPKMIVLYYNEKDIWREKDSTTNSEQIVSRRGPGVSVTASPRAGGGGGSSSYNASPATNTSSVENLGGENKTG